MNEIQILFRAAIISLAIAITSSISLGQNAVANPLYLNNENANDRADIKWLASELKPSKRFDGSKTPYKATIAQFENLLLSTLQWAKSTHPQSVDIKAKDAFDKLAVQWKQSNWNLKLSPAQTFLVICEPQGHRTGRGIYALRINPQSAIVLQAPHRFSDLLSGSIAMKLFYEHSISAIALNTIHRNEIDLSHTKTHYINAYTAAVLKANNQSAIVQLHGFTKKGKTGAAKFTKVIISDTTKFPGRSARQIAAELKTTFGPDHTRLFPVEIRQLGGTTNRQSELAHALGCPNFIHLEANYQFRTELHNDASTRQDFFASIIRGLTH